MIDMNLNTPQDLFQLYPLHNLRERAGGNAQVPYHVYDGTILLIGGTGDFEAVQALLREEGLEAVYTTRDEALISLWLCDFTHSSLGPHKILYAGISVALDAVQPVKPRPLALLDAVLMRPQVGMYFQGAWVDKIRAATYQSEMLDLDVHLAQGGIIQDPVRRSMEFEFWDVNEGKTLLSGQVRERAYTKPLPALALLYRFGLPGFLQVSRQPRFSLQVVSHGRGEETDCRLSKRISNIYWQSQHAVTQYFNLQSDQLCLNDAVFPGVEFHPKFVERLEGFKMVYFLPGKPKG
jgi:hypothetical protein